MKRPLLILLFLFTSGLANAQFFARLRITQLINFPDTAYEGVSYPVQLVLKNVGAAPFQGPVQVILQTDSAFDILYFSNSPAFTLLPNDTVVLSVNGSGLNGYYFTPQVFRPGNDVVVVWPYSTQFGVQYDSLFTAVRFVPLASLGEQEQEIGAIGVYPNPFTGILYLELKEGIHVEHVRIFDLTGRQVFSSGSVINQVPLQMLDAGIYIMEIKVSGRRSMQRVVKQ